MPGVAIEETVNCSNPLLQFNYHVNGILTNVYELKFTIQDIQNSTERVSLTTVTLTDCASGGDRLGTGRYVAQVEATVANGWEIGTHEITWSYKPESGDDTVTWKQRFEVLSNDVYATGRGYRAYADTSGLMKNSSLHSCNISDIQEALQTVTEQIEGYTGRFFDPTYINTQYNGVKGGALPLDNPIIGVSEVALVTGNVVGDETEVDLNDVLVYNRHLTDGLNSPDDRENPRLEYKALVGESWRTGEYLRYYWPAGRQNIRVAGVFGYTEYNGTPVGKRPRLLEKAAGIMTLREMSDPLGVDPFTSQPGRIRSARTRDQAVTFAGATDGGIGELTGDRIVDDILMKFRRPPYYGAVRDYKGSYRGGHRIYR